MFLNCSANTLRFADLPTRVAAAAAAGFTGIGLRVGDYLGAGLSDADIRDLLDHHGVRVFELEHTWDWAAGVDPAEEAMFRLAAEIGVRHLNVPMFSEHPLSELVEPFAALCDRAAEHGVLVGFEFLPYSHVRTLPEVWEVVAAADRRNGGVTFDLWHWLRSGGRPEDLAGVPASKIVTVQLCDVLPEPGPDLTEEARHRRLLPGRGAGDTAGVLRALREHGVTAPVSVEVFSDELDALPTADAARLAYGAGAEVLDRAGYPVPPWRTNLEQAR
ncbi:sugar phosphate isomerase/epimerase family protein [Amycolatopsis thermophila]|uniref:Sugar phosphate isomerase/epimerase n=1 Tax=Amycolatopsis thermophila TaxID=206084 RepID=A0ABU0F108_9PSEU|nr:sugar phosphate isomerase/epimerase [Amycolatopsis thermophila]MDQ0381258.1 sugar phosphate isomerase/epimerase [Amycolatopsis thermophila]